MKALRGIAWRVLLVAVAAGLGGSVIALTVATVVTREHLASQLVPLAASRFSSAEAAACESSPESWSMDYPLLGARGYAYDGATGASRNPAAPPLRRELLARLAPLADSVTFELFGLRGGGAIVHRTIAKAPCDVVQVLWHRRLARGRMGGIPLGSGIASALFASALGLLLLMRPLKQLDEAHAALERHLANIAHDVRTPLTSLQVSLEYAVDSSRDPALREILTGALGDTVYLDALTSNLRLASRLRTGWNPAADVTDVDFTALVTRVAARGQRLARRRQIELDVSVPDNPVIVACNALAAEQAIGNVVDNAVAHGDANGHVAVILTADERGFCIEVRDDGPGVPPQEIPRLGERTFRSDDARQRDPRGHGLGLAITAEVCDLFAWKLRFEALEPQGLLVVIASSP